MLEREASPAGALPVTAASAARGPREAWAVPGGRRPGSVSDPPRGMPRTRSLAREEEGTAGEMEAAGQGWAGRRVLPREWGRRLRLASALSVLIPPEPVSGSSTAAPRRVPPEPQTWRVSPTDSLRVPRSVDHPPYTEVTEI